MKLNTLKTRSFLAGALALALYSALPLRADYASDVLAQSPLAYWRFNETAVAPPLDSVTNSGSLGTTGDGYVVLDVLKGQAGVVGSSIRLNNAGGPVIGYSGSKVEIPFNPALNPKVFSIEFWAKPNSLPVSDATGLCPLSSFNQNWFGGANRSGWLFYVNNTGRWQFRLGLTSGYAAICSATSGNAVAGVWQHVAVTYDGLTVYIYVNGVLVNTTPSDASATGWLPNTQSSLRVGATPLNGTGSDAPSPVANGTAAQGHGGNRTWDGWMDEVAVYNTVLTPATVLAHYSAASTNNAGYHAQILAGNPVGYWGMDEAVVTPPDPSTFPIVTNSGTLGNAADGTNMWGALTAQSGSGYAGLGASNKAIFFDDANGYIGLQDAAGLHFAGNITMMAWVKPAVQDFFRTIIAHGWDINHAETFLRISRGVGGSGAGDSNYYEVGVTDNSGYYDSVLFPMPAGDIGNWVFLVGTYDGANWRLYRNGGLVGTLASANGALDVATRWSIGSRSSPAPDPALPLALGGLFFGGLIDEPAIFSTALSAGTITALYNAAQVKPVISQPVTVPTGVYKGSSATFSVGAEGSPTLGYLWSTNGVSTGVTTTNLTLNNLAAGNLTVAVVVTNGFGSATSSVSLVVVASKPLITVQPKPITRYNGLPFTFSVTAAGTTPIFYQWNTNGAPIPGATSSTYSGIVSAATAKNYSVTLTNEAGSSNSISVALTAVPIPSGYAGAVFSNAPIAFWRLGETSGSVALDKYGGNDGTYFATALGQPGYSAIDPDTAVGFAGGIGSYVGNISGTGINFQGHTNFTLELWANGPAGQDDESTLIAKGNGQSGTTASEQFSIDVVGFKYRFFTRGGGNSLYTAEATVGPNGTWQHIVGVYNDTSGEMKIYVDGVVSGTGSPRPAGLRASSVPVSIGSKHLGNSPDYDGGFTGTIDEVAAYSYALSEATIQTHYAAAYGTNFAPVIDLQPQSVTNYVGLPVTLSVHAYGTPPISYQWKKGGVPLSDGGTISGANSSALTISSLVLSDAGSYSVTASNPVNGTSTTNSAVAVLTVFSAPSSPPAIPGLVLHLPFDNNLTDVTGRTNNGTGIHISGTSSNTATPTYVADGKLGQGLHFSTDAATTNNDYVTLGVRPDLQFSSNVNFTVALWIRTPANMTFGDLPYLCNAVGSTFTAPGIVFAYTYGYGATPYPGGWAFSVYDTAGNGVGGRGEVGSINDGSWHHLVHVFDRKAGNANYLDGVPVKFNKQNGTSVTAARASIDTGLSMNIGQDPSGTYPESGSGDIDDLGIWKKALTPLEAASLYVAATNGFSFTGSTTFSLSATRSGNNLILSWTVGVLQQADVVTGPYTDVPGATSPRTVALSAATKKFYRLRL